MTTSTHSRPTHRVYVVIKKPGNSKGRWIEIGAAWPHKDGQGFNLSCDTMPQAGAEIIIRKIREKSEVPATA